MPQAKWIGLGYFIPANPSKARVFVWRKLKALGAQAIRPGLAALPNTRENVTQFLNLSEKIEGFAGEAMLIEFNFLRQHENTALKTRFEEAGQAQYQAMLEKCQALIERLSCSGNTEEQGNLEQQLLKTIQKYRESPPLSLGQTAAQELERGLSEMLGTLKSMPAELRGLLKR